MLKTEMSAESNFLTVEMEYRNIPAGESGKAFFPLKLFRRINKQAFYPFRIEDIGKKRQNIKKVDGEIRFVSVDIATRAAKTNDLSVISLVRCVPTKRGYVRQLQYMETFKGKNTILQSLRIKQLYFDYEADWIVMDTQNAGIGVFDALGVLTTDDEKGVEYPPMTVANFPFIDEKVRIELSTRTLGTNPISVIFPISASQNLNSQIASSFRSSLQKRLWEFLVQDNEAEEYLLTNNKDFKTNSDDETERAFWLSPFLQTNFAINECINLDLVLVNGNIKLQENSGSYKDRYVSIAYCNWIISEVFDPLVIRDETMDDDWEVLSSYVQYF
jgi:hypothetical protein